MPGGTVRTTACRRVSTRMGGALFVHRLEPDDSAAQRSRCEVRQGPGEGEYLMPRYSGMAMHTVLDWQRLGRDINAIPLYRLTLDCGHVEERVIRSFVPKRTRCHQCDTPTSSPKRTPQPSGLQAP